MYVQVSTFLKEHKATLLINLWLKEFYKVIVLAPLPGFPSAPF
jgi:hypothetical protein